MPDVDSMLRLIAQWKHITSTDLTSAFYQIPLSRDSMKYCRVATPFRGIRVYARSAMGMPGSKTALEELMSRVLGDLLKEGHSQCQPSSHRCSSLVPRTRHRYPNEVIHRSIQGALPRYPRMLFTSCKTRQHCCRP